MHFILDAIAMIGVTSCLAMLGWHVRTQVKLERRKTGFHRRVERVSREPSYLRSKDR